jgi:penicillin-binding protein 1C
VTQEKICWPLGGRYAQDDEQLCAVKRTAWTLNGAAPPTFADRLRPASPRTHYYVDATTGLRVSPDCTTRTLRAVETARWPTLIEPWLDSGLRSQALPPAWAPQCRGRHDTQAVLKIVGLNTGSVIQQANGGSAPVVRLGLRGQQGPVHWIVNGRVLAYDNATSSQAIQFNEPGRYDITALDQEGRFDRISISVRATGIPAGMKKPGA